MKINKKYVLGSVALLALSLSSYELGRYQAVQTGKESNRVAYIDGNQASTKTENLTPDEVSQREGINAEQIVVKITDQGYVNFTWETIIITLMVRFLMTLLLVKNS